MKGLHDCPNCKENFKNKFQLINHRSRKCKKNKVCPKCNTVFHKIRDLERHRKNSKHISCDHCRRTFCNREHFQQHLRTIRKISDIPDLNQPIIQRTGYEDYDGFKAVIKSKINEIRDREKRYKTYKVINREIDSSFTYKDIEDIVTHIYCQQPNSFKVNIAFGFILYNPIEDEFKYFYISSNHMLFEHAVTIADRQDLSNFIKKVANLDLATNYSLKKPSSEWVLAGLTNLEIYIFDMKDVPIGRPPTDLPDNLKKFQIYLRINAR